MKLRTLITLLSALGSFLMSWTAFHLLALGMAIGCLFGTPECWRESTAWFCAFLLSIVTAHFERRVKQLEASQRLHIKFLNGPNRSGGVGRAVPCAPPKVELRGAPPRSPYHSRGAQS